MTTTAMEQKRIIQEALAAVRAVSEEQAGALVGALERGAAMEASLRKLVGATEFYMNMVGRPMTLHRGIWDEMGAALAEGLARVRG